MSEKKNKAVVIVRNLMDAMFDITKKLGDVEFVINQMREEAMNVGRENQAADTTKSK